MLEGEQDHPTKTTKTTGETQYCFSDDSVPSEELYKFSNERAQHQVTASGLQNATSEPGRPESYPGVKDWKSHRNSTSKCVWAVIIILTLALFASSASLYMETKKSSEFQQKHGKIEEEYNILKLNFEKKVREVKELQLRVRKLEQPVSVEDNQESNHVDQENQQEVIRLLQKEKQNLISRVDGLEKENADDKARLSFLAAYFHEEKTKLGMENMMLKKKTAHAKIQELQKLIKEIKHELTLFPMESLSQSYRGFIDNRRYASFLKDPSITDDVSGLRRAKEIALIQIDDLMRSKTLPDSFRELSEQAEERFSSYSISMASMIEEKKKFWEQKSDWIMEVFKEKAEEVLIVDLVQDEQA